MTAAKVAPMKFQQWACRPPLPGGIVVGMDGSPESLAAAAAAAKFSAVWGCPVHVVSVLPPFTDYRIDPGSDQPQSQIEDLRIQLRAQAIRDIVADFDVEGDWTRQVVVGKVSRTIVDAAERRGAELIIVGRTKHGLADKLLGGETTLQVMRLASVPVLAVTEDFDMPRVAVVAVDFGASSERAARFALQMLGATGILYLVHVEPVLELGLEGSAIVEEVINTDAIISRFRRLAIELGTPRGVIVETIVLNGRAQKETLEFAGRVGADLLAVGTHGPGIFDRFLLGSVSTSLVRNSTVSTIAVPEVAPRLGRDV